jgi:hypothetical protein
VADDAGGGRDRVIPLTPQDRKRANAELEEQIREAGENYERYLLADAYHHAAMRRRTREDAIRFKTDARRVSRLTIATEEPGAANCPYCGDVATTGSGTPIAGQSVPQGPKLRSRKADAR